MSRGTSDDSLSSVKKTLNHIKALTASSTLPRMANARAVFTKAPVRNILKGYPIRVILSKDAGLPAIHAESLVGFATRLLVWTARGAGIRTLTAGTPPFTRPEPSGTPHSA
jgi:hypothetical protein